MTDTFPLAAARKYAEDTWSDLSDYGRVQAADRKTAAEMVQMRWALDLEDFEMERVAAALNVIALTRPVTYEPGEDA